MNQEKKVLRKGLTTGVHTCCAFSSVLEAFIVTKEFVFGKINKIDNDDLDVTKDIVTEPKVIKSEKQTENSTSEEFEQVVKDIEINHQKLIKDDLDNELLAREKQQLKESMDKENQAKKYAKDNPELAAELIKVWMKDK